MTGESAQRIADSLTAQAVGRAKQRAEELFGDQPAGTQDLGRKATLAMLARNGNDPTYLEALLTRVGPVNFRDMVVALHGGNESVWPLPWEAPLPEAGQTVPIKVFGQELSDVTAQRWLGRDESAPAAAPQTGGSSAP